MTDLIKRIEILQQLLISKILNEIGSEKNAEYVKLRAKLLKIKNLKPCIPKLIKQSRSLEQADDFLKNSCNSFIECKEYIYEEFSRIFEILEDENLCSIDDLVLSSLEKLGSDHIHLTWQKALERRYTDPEGAITLARTLLESTCKYILDEYQVDYGNAPDINQLYRLVSKELNLAPSQHTEQTFKQILGGCSSIVEGLGSLRNKVGDAHGQGKTNFKPSPRHAELAVNLAGTMAVFLFSTWDINK